ncbi:MAG TPA: DUF1343 domain-containing protein, partial [Polyangiaceae bacterium LLY-WYZ-15_(1-7)]|nr:DUF1343 domain-containing protein [Polyangiaceae bacterium LLY-WYZ-15_(1-7)]
MSVATGLDRIVADDGGVREAIAGKRIGLLAHPASVDRRLRHALPLLQELAEVRVLFGPEHGWAGTAQDMAGVEGSAEAALRVVSLYGSTAAELHPKASDLEGLDAVVVDLQDVGSRYYTFVWTAAFMLRVAAKAGVETVVLDRPNPIGGAVVEGMPQRPGYRSFVGLYDVAVRHGLTIGEMCEWVRCREGIDEAALRVVELRGWERRMWFDETGLPWVLPSPNMPTLDTATVYPGGCVIEGTTLSEGRGTTRPFEIWGAPGVAGAELAEIEVEGATLRPLAFEPTFQKHAKATCGGVQVHVSDRERFRSYQAYLRWIAAALQQRPDDVFPWRTEEYEYE